MKHPVSRATRLASSVGVLILVLAASGVYVASQTPAAKPAAVDREYILESSMLGYRGVGGDIDGVRNPTLWARTGESVRITIVNGELMVHDIALEGLNIKSPQILDKAARTNITFTATKSDIYYCSVPGHRLAGMEGRLEVSDEPRVPSDGVPAAGERPRAQPRLRERHARRLDGDRRCVRARQGRRRPWTGSRQARRQGQRLLGQQQHRRRRAQGHADIGAVPREPAVCQLPRVRRRVHEHARRAGPGARRWHWPRKPDRAAGHLHHLGCEQRDAAAGRRRSEDIMPARTSSFGWWTTRRARRSPRT